MNAIDGEKHEESKNKIKNTKKAKKHPPPKKTNKQKTNPKNKINALPPKKLEKIKRPKNRPESIFFNEN